MIVDAVRSGYFQARFDHKNNTVRVLVCLHASCLQRSSPGLFVSMEPAALHAGTNPCCPPLLQVHFGGQEVESERVRCHIATMAKRLTR